jgi:16S rRNA (guanine966-N2)-methyltransferase
LRIISGEHKGRRINPPSGFSARPTTDFAREALFNILVNRVDFETTEVLDLFSGTGSISYEFASRGAKSVHLVEKDIKHFSFIRKMITDLKFDRIKPFHGDVRVFLKVCKLNFDIIFADPPYDLEWLETIPDLVISSDLLKEDGFFILEHPRDLSFTSNKYFFEHRNYGSVNFSFFKKRKEA